MQGELRGGTEGGGGRLFLSKVSFRRGGFPQRFSPFSYSFTYQYPFHINNTKTYNLFTRRHGLNCYLSFHNQTFLQTTKIFNSTILSHTTMLEKYPLIFGRSPPNLLGSPHPPSTSGGIQPIRLPPADFRLARSAHKLSYHSSSKRLKVSKLSNGNQ